MNPDALVAAAIVLCFATMALLFLVCVVDGPRLLVLSILALFSACLAGTSLCLILTLAVS